MHQLLHLPASAVVCVSHRQQRARAHGNRLASGLHANISILLFNISNGGIASGAFASGETPPRAAAAFLDLPKPPPRDSDSSIAEG